MKIKFLPEDIGGATRSKSSLFVADQEMLDEIKRWNAMILEIASRPNGLSRGNLETGENVIFRNEAATEAELQILSDAHNLIEGKLGPFAWEFVRQARLGNEDELT